MKKIMFLGGSYSQLEPIRRAKELGYYTILCDYLPDNPGRLIADEWYSVSTTDYEAVLKVAQDCKIDGIMCFCSDVAASTVAYVAEKMGLPGSPYESVYLLTHKDKFREFLRNNGFCAPWSCGFEEYELEEAKNFALTRGFPVVVKPVDSQGARGISRADDVTELENAVKQALSQSRSKRFILEEYLERDGWQIGGDAFSVDGQIVLMPFDNTYFENGEDKQFIPMAEIWPPVTPSKILDKVLHEIQRLLSLLHMGTQPYNIEAMVDKRGEVYLLEVGPRNGGALVSALNEKMLGVSAVEMTIRAAAGDELPKIEPSEIQGFWATRGIYCKDGGKLIGFDISRKFREKNLVMMEQYIEYGKPVRKMTGLNAVVAYVGAHFDTREEMMRFVTEPDLYCRPLVSPE